MIDIKRIFEDGTTDTTTHKSVKAFESSKHAKVGGLKAYQIIDTITKAIISMVLLVKTVKG